MLIAVFPRLLARRALAFCASLAATTALFAQSATALDGFNPDVDGNVYALAVQADGKLLVAGQFTTVGGVQRNNLARLNADGSVDTAFNPNPNAPVRALIVQSNGQILIAGDFESLQTNAAGTPVARGRIARLNADGSVETSFAPNFLGESLPGGSGQLRAQLFALAVQPDGSILVGGSFGGIQPGVTAQIIARRNLARLSSTGVVDASFDPRPNGQVLALAMHVDNKILVGGGFTEFQPNGAPSSGRNRIARLNPNGTVDSEFSPNANNGVAAITVQRDGKILLGGFFTTLQPVGEESPANRTHFARLNLNGSLDSEFISRAEGNVSTIAVQPDGAILIGGAFNAVWGRGSASVGRGFVARFLTDGSVDAGFAPAVNGQVDAFAFQADGKIVIGGHFTRAVPRGGSTAIVRNHLARLDADGALDTNFQLDPGGRVLASVTQADGRIVIAGTFTSVGGATHNYLARLNADGSVDPTYAPVLNGPVYTLAYEAGSNKVIAGGDFTTVGGETRNHIARFNANGTIDSEFYPSIDGRVGAIVVQSDGRILVGGSFSNVTPVATSTASIRANLLRLNANGTLDTGFDPSPNSSISAIAVHSDGKIYVGGLFSAFLPGSGSSTGALSSFGRSFFARLNADGTVDTAFNTNPNGQVSAIVVQGDGKVVLGGAFTLILPNAATEAVTRNRLARLNADGTIDTPYDPNANGNVLAMGLQSDGKVVIGGSFTTLQPNGRSDWILRKYAARLNTDGTVDDAFNLDINELPGNRVDSLRVQANGQILVGGSFSSLQPAGTPTRITRANFARVNANGTVDTAFDAGAGGSTSAIVNGLAIQPDGRIIAVGSFVDLGGAKSTNIARFRPEGTVDPDFSNSLTTDGAVNAVAIRPNVTPVASQLSGFAWLNANGTLRAGFAANARLSGEVTAIAVDAQGRVLLGGTFANLANSAASNLVRFNADGTLDTSFAPNPNGQVTGIVVQSDGRIVIVGAFTTVSAIVRNRIARIDANGSLDVTYDPNANGRINAVVIEGDGRVVVGGNFTSLTPNLGTTATARNFLARINADGSLDSNYNPGPNSSVNALAIQGDGKIIAGGTFTSVAPNNATSGTTRSGVARLNADGSLDQNFDPNANGAINAIIALANGQIVLGGGFTTLQPRAAGTVFTRNHLARVNSDGAVDEAFNPNPNGNVTTLALQSDGSVLVGGVFTALQPGATGAPVTRNRLARLAANGSIDLNFNPDVNGSVSALLARPDGSVLVGGNFTDLRLIGSIVVGGDFRTIGGVPARNLAMLNDNGSVNTTFQPAPDGAVNALLVQPDGAVVVGGAFANIAGAGRRAIARFAADGSLDAAFAPTTVPASVTALARQPDGKILVGGSAGGVLRLNASGSVDESFTMTTNEGGAAVRGLAVQPDGRILVLSNTLVRRNADGTPDASISLATNAGFRSFALQADGGILVTTGSPITTSAGEGRPYLARLLPGGALDASFNPAPNGPVTAVALQPDGRIVVGGGFTRLGEISRVGIGRLAATSPATQMLGVSANRTTVTWTRGGSTGELSAVVFEQSSDRVTWTRLGEGTRVANSSNWQIGGLNLPAGGVFYIRARGIAPSTVGTSSGIYELVREFNFSNPVPGATQSTMPATASSPVMAFDPFTGIAVRAMTRSVAGEGTVEIIAANSPEGLAGTARLANLSTRGRVTAGDPLILGFAIAGSEPRRVLVRAVGPALAGFGVTDALAATRLQVYNSAGALIGTNEGWGNAAELAQAAAATGAFPLAAGSADSAAVLSLSPGIYTMQIVDTRGSGGVALAEIYDAGTGAGSRLVNVSSRGSAGAGNAALISGFVIAGNAPQRVLLRAVGPGLARFAAGSVADPSIALYDGEGRELGSNDNWVSTVPDISASAARAGAFALENGSKDAAVLATLPAGAYTTQVRATATGTALLEIYDVQ